MKKHLIITIGVLFLIACLTQTTQKELIKSSYKKSWKNIKPVAPISSSYKLYWQDDFKGTKLNENIWRTRNGKRKQGYLHSDAISLTNNGTAKITVFKKDNKYYGGILDTKNKLKFKYGHFECRVKLQKQAGYHSAFWLQSKTVDIVGNTENTGTEIDIFEYLKRKGDIVQHTLHWDGYGEHHKIEKKLSNIKGLQAGWHTFSVTWTNKGYTFYVDGKKVWHTIKAISKVPQFILLSSVITTWGGDITQVTLPDSLEIDYVRVFKKK